MFQTRITKLLGIQYPIIGGCMLNISYAELVAAIANAGALGILVSASHPNKESLRDEIRKTKDLTDKPFGVNINLFPSRHPVDIDGFIDTAIEQGVAVIETSGRSPNEYVARIKQGNVKYMHKCARVRDAVTAARLGADAVTVVGFECGGHPGMDDVTTLVLVPLAVDAVSVPVIAGGGFGDGRGLVAALALGAEAIVMGTRFIATKECLAHDHLKEWMVNAGAGDTTIIQRTIQSNVRVIKNAPAERVLDLEAHGASLEELLTVISGEHGRKVLTEGALDAGTFACGQVVGMIRNVPTVQELVTSIVAQAEEAHRKLASVVVQ